MKVGFKQLGKGFTCFRFDSLRRKPQVRPSAIQKNPVTDLFFGSVKSEFTPMITDILGKSAFGALRSVVLTCKSCRIVRLPNSEPLIGLEENIDCSLIWFQWPRPFMRVVFEIEVDFLEGQLRSLLAVRFQNFPSLEEIAQTLLELFPRPHCNDLIDERRRARSTSPIRFMLYKCSTSGDSLTRKIPASRPSFSLSILLPYTMFPAMSVRGISRYAANAFALFSIPRGAQEPLT